jgi:hypothetical protein
VYVLSTKDVINIKTKRQTTTLPFALPWLIADH